MMWNTNRGKCGFDSIILCHHERLGQNFFLEEKIRTRASSANIPANYTSEESFKTAVYDKNII